MQMLDHKAQKVRYVASSCLFKFDSGTPLHRGGRHSVAKLIDDCCAEAEVYSRLGLDSVLVENMNDIPYVTENEAGPEVGSTMAVICREVRKVFPASKPVGKSHLKTI